MGEVYKARDTRLDRTVAIKILPATLAADPQFRERFDREARAISQLRHPHICTLYDVGEQQGARFSSWSISKARRWPTGSRKGALPLDAGARRLRFEIADALERGASRRHRSPRSEAGQRDAHEGRREAPRLRARESERAADRAAPGCRCCRRTPPNLTAQGTILGTFQYMAPEQLEGKEADARTDIFAFGAVLYEMLTGKRAFSGASHGEL